MKYPATNRYPATILIIGGFVAWSAAFTLMYATLSFGCAYGWDAVAVGPVSLNRAALTIAWIVSLAGIGALLWANVRLYYAEGKGVSPFLRASGVALTALALATTVVNFFMVTTMSTCL
jgi:hypothetical protein